MMLHRHFESDKSKNMTTFSDVREINEGEDFVSEVFPPEEEAKPKRGRKKKVETEE